MRALLVTALLATPAFAESRHLADGRKAIDDVRFDDAQRSLLAALQAGGNDLAATREIYRLLAHASAALGRADDAEQYDRVWIAIDPSASLGADVSPKLREPFDAAKSFVAARGGLDIDAATTADGIIVRVASDPVGIARAAKLVTGADLATFDTARSARVAGAGRIAVVDRYGNTIAELDPTPAVKTLGGSIPFTPRDDAGPRDVFDETAPSRHSTAFYVLAVPTGLALAAGLGFGITSLVYSNTAIGAAEDSGTYYYSDVTDAHDKATRFWKLAAITGGVGAVLAIPTLILYSRGRDRGAPAVAPFASDTSMGVSLRGAF